MRKNRGISAARRPEVIAILSVVFCSVYTGADLQGKEKKIEVDPNDCTCRLFQFLDESRGGKLDDFYVLGDLYQDPKSGDQLRHIFKVEYDKGRAFGKLRISVRAVGKMNDQQLSTYTPQQIFDFGESELEKIVRTDCGAFGKPGDVDLIPNDDGALATVAITDDTRKRYDGYVCQYILPALQKK